MKKNMGNCLKRSGSSNKDDDDQYFWSSSSHRRHGSRVMDESGGGRGGGGGGGEEVLVQKQSLLGSSVSSSSSNNKSITREVKIKITKKELEELIGKADVQGLSVEQVLAELINSPDYHDHGQDHRHKLHHQRSWRPVLQTIPEVN
ncbi:hypothetical protein Dsin_027929 [Dipteronia sinensis]|uniref:Uncharacterized protein n=1 Tax=Dipteronia sinensis TaxID=43782 RepID=A0AAD9ZPE2_9ROSI|nr:hypothetical protein Dsin_027929 [Dipteronia sinensis]